MFPSVRHNKRTEAEGINNWKGTMTTTKTKINVLIADDEPFIREIVQDILEMKFEVNVFQAATGREAISILETKPIQIIFCDMNMPGGTGEDVYVYNKRLKNLPYVLMSTEDPKDWPRLEGFHEDNLNRYLGKPFDIDDIEKIFTDLVKDFEEGQRSNLHVS
jgi:CheY-like chemotaxis protein